MKSEFSESTFGFVYTHELANLWGGSLQTMPVFPTLREEGKTGGFDVRLEAPGVTYCVQFKTSERLTRSSASESRLGYTLPYFRFGIYGSKKSNQHKLLCDLELGGTCVEYVAPLFVSNSALSRAFQSADLRKNVIRVRPSAIGSIGEEPHKIVCDTVGDNVTLFSEPVVLDGPLDYGEIDEAGFAGRRAPNGIDSEQSVKDGLENVVRTLLGPEALRMVSDEDSGRALLRAASFATRSRLGAELFLLS